MEEDTKKRCTKCGEFKDRAQFSKDKSSADLIMNHCKACCSAKHKAWREKNGQRCKEYYANWREENKESQQKKRQDYYLANKTKINARNREYYRNNTEKCAATVKAYVARNPSMRAAIKARRRAAKKQATPAWANKKAIDSFYESSHALGMLLGEWYHVDHIVPLQSPLVCGLHCEANLQILPAKENLSKQNCWWPDMWEPELSQ